MVQLATEGTLPHEPQAFGGGGKSPAFETWLHSENVAALTLGGQQVAEL